MARLNDIQIFWDMSNKMNYDDKKMLDGQILLDDDGGFEGVVKSDSSENVVDDLIFGIYYPDVAIEAIKVSPYLGDGPYYYRGKKDAKGYDGTFGVITAHGDVAYGTSHKITRDVLLFQEHNYSDVAGRNIEEEKAELIRRIAEFKVRNEIVEEMQKMYSIKAKVVGAMLSDQSRDLALLNQDEARSVR